MYSPPTSLDFRAAAPLVGGPLHPALPAGAVAIYLYTWDIVRRIFSEQSPRDDDAVIAISILLPKRPLVAHLILYERLFIDAFVSVRRACWYAEAGIWQYLIRVRLGVGFRQALASPAREIKNNKH